MDVGEVRVAEDADFNRLKSLCDDTNGWKQEYNKNNTTVWTKINELSEFQMVKVSILIFCHSKYFICHFIHYDGFEQIFIFNKILNVGCFSMVILCSNEKQIGHCFLSNKVFFILFFLHNLDSVQNNKLYHSDIYNVRRMSKYFVLYITGYENSTAVIYLGNS